MKLVINSTKLACASDKHVHTHPHTRTHTPGNRRRKKLLDRREFGDIETLGRRVHNPAELGIRRSIKAQASKVGQLPAV